MLECPIREGASLKAVRTKKRKVPVDSRPARTLRTNHDIDYGESRTLIRVKDLLLMLPLLDPTFLYHKDGENVGNPKTRGHNMLQEMFTDADDFDAQLPAEDGTLLLGLVFLIDFVSFEKDQSD